MCAMDPPPTHPTAMTHHIFLNHDTLEVILDHLAPADIKSAALVCRTWRTVVEKPRYWSWTKARLRSLSFREIFNSERFRNIGHVQFDLSDPEMKEEFFRTVGLRNPDLRSMEMVGVNLSSVSSEFLAQTATRLEELTMIYNVLKPSQVTHLFSQLVDTTNTNLKLVKLNLRGTRLDSLSPELLSLHPCSRHTSGGCCHILSWPGSLPGSPGGHVRSLGGGGSWPRCWLHESCTSSNGRNSALKSLRAGFHTAGYGW